MKILFVVQRYGARIAGGAEQLTRQFAERLTDRGHEVHVVTSAALSHSDWANAYPTGTSEERGVTVHRLPVSRPRDNRLFGPVNRRVTAPGERPPSPVLADTWAQQLGPDLVGLEATLRDLVPGVDVTVVSGYMFSTSLRGAPVAAALGPVVLQPVVHDEPYVRLPAVRALFDHASAICSLTDDEADLIRARFRPRVPVEVVGAGVELSSHSEPGPADEDTRSRYGITKPYIVCIGRIEPGKGTPDLVSYFLEYASRRDRELQLVLVGSGHTAIANSPDVVITGFVDEDVKASLLRSAELLVQPSYYESFSLSLVEGWLSGRAALVQGWCAVLEGQVQRSEGGLVYHNYAEFEVALDVLLDHSELRAELAQNGARYAQRYKWNAVLNNFEGLLHRVVEHSGEAGEGPSQIRGG